MCLSLLIKPVLRRRFLISREHEAFYYLSQTGDGNDTKIWLIIVKAHKIQQANVYDAILPLLSTIFAVITLSAISSFFMSRVLLQAN